MTNAYFVRAYYYALGETQIDEFFTVAADYKEVTAQVENAYKPNLLAISCFTLDSDFIYLDLAADFLEKYKNKDYVVLDHEDFKFGVKA